VTIVEAAMTAADADVVRTGAATTANTLFPRRLEKPAAR
jgi:hypothetical protein